MGLFQLFVGVLWLSLFFLCITSFAIILKRKKKLVALLLLSYRCIVTVIVLLLVHGVVGRSVMCD